MKQKGFLKVLSKDNRYIVNNIMYIQFIQGLYAILIGAIFPMMQQEYGIHYNTGGLMLSGHSLGLMLGSLIAGAIQSYIGIKTSILLLNTLTYIGFTMMLLTGNPVLLIVAFILAGIGRGGNSNYNNALVNSITNGNGGALNLIHAFFAIGAFVAPILVLVLTRNSDMGWKYAIVCVVILGAISLFTSSRMKFDRIKEKEDVESNSFAFFKDKLFIIVLILLFLYLCVESAVIGWITTYFVDTNIIKPQSAQLLTSLLWFALLIGRIICISLSNIVKAEKLVFYLSCGSVIFMIIVLMSKSLLFMGIGVFGLGLSFSGIYATAIAGIGGIMKKYSHAMGFLVAIVGIGSIISPSIVGVVSEKTNIHTGISVLLVFAVLQLVVAAYNVSYSKRVANNKS